MGLRLDESALEEQAESERLIPVARVSEERVKPPISKERAEELRAELNRLRCEGLHSEILSNFEAALEKYAG